MKDTIIEKTNKIVQQIKQNSQRPIENIKLVRDYIFQSFKDNKKITFYNWECPPRFLDKDKNGQIFINYDVDLEKICKGKKIDRFTELPRVIVKNSEEKKILKFINSLGINFRFVKLVADTNAYYLTPESLKILGKKKIIHKFVEFKKLIIKYTNQYPADVDVYLFTDLIKNYRNFYDSSFKKAMAILKEDSQQMISNKILQQQFGRTKDHLGFKNKNKINDFVIKTIASYAVEGIVFDKLTKSKNFSNCIWLNIEEADQRTIKITNCLRTKRNLGKMPMIFSMAQPIDNNIDS